MTSIWYLPHVRSLRTLSLATVLALSGCQPSSSVPVPGTSDRNTGASDSHDGDEHASAPETLGQALAQLEDLGEHIKAAFDAGQPGDAHDELHVVGDALHALTMLAPKSELAEADKKAVSTAVENLYDQYGKLDGTLHGGPEIKYEDVATEIEAAMATLQGKITADHTGHDHDGAGHDDDDHDHAEDQNHESTP